MAWFEKQVIGFDVETTGRDNQQAQILQWAWVLINPDGSVERPHSCLVMPDCEIDEEASKVHGYTEETLEQKGALPRGVGLNRLFDLMWWAKDQKVPLSAFNSCYDMTILFYESRRLGHALPKLPVIDPLVIDRKFDKWRKGKRKLPNICEHYGIPTEGEELHDAEADAILCVRAAYAMGRDLEYCPEKVSELHRRQAKWHSEWAAGLQKYLRGPKGGQPDAVVDQRWPYQVDELTD